MRNLLAIAVLSALPTCLAAQSFTGLPAFSGRPASFPAQAHRGAGFRPSFYPLGLYDPFYSDMVSSTGYPLESQPPLVVQVAPAAAKPEPSAAPPAQPLLIELQGDRYVQLSGEKETRAQMIDENSAQAAVRRMPGTEVQSAPRPNPNALLVFRDGHREEVTNYTITNGVLYAGSDSYVAGSWNRKIELSSLNLPETVDSNRSRGLRFQLPNAPNQVIVGP